MNTHEKPTGLAASLALTSLASAGTSVIWNGLPFIAKHQYGFDETATLLLYLLVGSVYIFGAMCSSRWARAMASTCSPRTILAVLLMLQAAVCSLPLFFSDAWVIWVAGGVAGLCSALLWPLVESFLVSGRHGRAMRRAIGWWNIVWMISVASTMFAMAPLMENHASMVIVALGCMNLLAVCVLPFYKSRPARHDEEIAACAVPSGYSNLLKGARLLLPLSYIINGTLAPLLPFVLSNLAVDTFWQTPAVATWMIARVVVTACMWHWPNWHGRWSVLWIAVAMMAIGFVSIFMASGMVLLFTGLVLFGGGMGIAYYAGLYYAMAVGRAGLNASGTHEALIGAGYTVGPAVGMLSIASTQSDLSTSPSALIGTVGCLIVVAMASLWVIWRKAR